MKTRVAVVALWAEDVEATAEFYRSVIGLKPLKERHKRPHFDVDGTYVTIVQGKPTDAVNSSPVRFPLVAFEVADLEEALERLRQNNVRLPWGVGHDAHSRWVMFRDPGGNLVELVEETTYASAH
jgi:catechol-2,3-dioxygenase